MPVSGLVLTLSQDVDKRESALQALRTHPALTLGPQSGQRLPAVVETASDEEDRQVWDWLQALPGVVQVDVACIHFEQPESPP